MTQEIERMVVTRVIDAPRELVWRAWTEPEYAAKWWGPVTCTVSFCRIDFRVGGKFLFCMKMPDGMEACNGGEYHEIVLHEKIVFELYFADADGNKVSPAELGIEHEAIPDAYDFVTFEDLGEGRTKLTFTGNEPMAHAKESGQLEGWVQLLEKFAGVVAGVSRAEAR